MRFFRSGLLSRVVVLACMIASVALFVLSATGIAFLALLPPAPAQTGAQLVWGRDFNSSLNQARTSRKYVLVDFYTDWCTWCKRLDNETYAHPTVVTYLNRGFVCLKLNAEDGGQGQQLANRYNVNAFPCTVVLDATGRQRGLFYGFRQPAPFIQEIQDILR